MAGVVQGRGQAAANALASTLNIVLANPITDGNDLIAGGYFNSAGTRSFSGPSGSWSQSFDDAEARATWANLNPTAGGTTIVGSNGGVNSHMTLYAAEVNGLRVGGQVFANTRRDQTGISDWQTNALVIDRPCLVFAHATHAADGSTKNVWNAGWTPLTGTGLDADGNLFNVPEGDVLTVGWAIKQAGSHTASGVFGTSGVTAINISSWLVAYELIQLDGTYQLPSDLYF